MTLREIPGSIKLKFHCKRPPCKNLALSVQWNKSATILTHYLVLEKSIMRAAYYTYKLLIKLCLKNLDKARNPANKSFIKISTKT